MLEIIESDYASRSNLDFDNAIMRTAQQRAVHALPIIAGADSALPLLSDLLEDSRPHIRVAAVRALEGMGSEAAPVLPQLRNLASSDPDDDVSLAATQAVEAIEQAAAD